MLTAGIFPLQHVTRAFPETQPERSLRWQPGFRSPLLYAALNFRRYIRCSPSGISASAVIVQSFFFTLVAARRWKVGRWKDGLMATRGRRPGLTAVHGGRTRPNAILHFYGLKHWHVLLVLVTSLTVLARDVSRGTRLSTTNSRAERARS